MISNGQYPLTCEYYVLVVQSNKPYWLSDGIYLNYPCFVHSILNPASDDDSYYTAIQEDHCKDVECCFGVIK